MMITRRGVIAGLSASGAFPYLAQAAWPDRPITMLHGFAPGGGADANARIAADGLSKVLGQTVLVESKSGAGTTLASAQLVRATPDGYTIALVATSYCATAALYKKLPYRPVEDINAIGLISEAPYVIATYAEHPARSLSQMFDIARKNDGHISYGTPGVGSGNHLATELLAQRAGVKLTHVPFRGGAQAVVEVLGQRIDFMIDPPLSMIEHLKSGKFRGLAVSTTARFPALPDIPTVQESGISDFDVAAWYALVAPAATPAPVVQRLNDAIGEVLAAPAARDRLLALGAVPKSSSPKQLTDLIAADIRRWTEVIEKAGIERI